MAKTRKKSKEIGNNYERKIAKLFTKWWGQEFRRVPNSGALRWAGVWWSYSDLLPPDDCLMIIECKHHRSAPRLENLLHESKPKTGPYVWWEQVCQDWKRFKNEVGYPPFKLLVYRYLRSKDYVAFDNCHHINIPNSIKTQKFTITTLNEFFKHVSPDSVKYQVKYNV